MYLCYIVPYFCSTYSEILSYFLENNKLLFERGYDTHANLHDSAVQNLESR